MMKREQQEREAERERERERERLLKSPYLPKIKHCSKMHINDEDKIIQKLIPLKRLRRSVRLFIYLLRLWVQFPGNTHTDKKCIA